MTVSLRFTHKTLLTLARKCSTTVPSKKKLSHLHMRSGDDDGDSDGDDDISFDVLETVCCCLSMLCKTKKSHNHNPFSQEKFGEIGEMAGVTAHKNFGTTVGKTQKKYL